MKFEIKPVNRQILITECDDPRLAHEEGVIDTKDVRGTLGFALVLAMDETPYIVREGEHVPPKLCEPGDVIYFDPNVIDTFIDVGCQGRMLIHEGQIKAVVKAPAVEKKDSDPRNREKKSKGATLLVPGSRHVN